MSGEFKLRSALPWGRSGAEYAAFFDLQRLSPNGRILDCAAGPSSFNAEWSDAGRQAVSVDPLYGYAPAAIEARVAEARPLMMAGLRNASARFVWEFHGSLAGLEAMRMAAMRRFLGDFASGRADGRYLVAALPHLPLPGGSFDLVLCSHFLFMYSAQFDVEFHLAALMEMARVGSEVRVFPLLDLDGRPSRHLAPVLRELAAKGFDASRQVVAYEFQKGGNEMLRLVAR